MYQDFFQFKEDPFNLTPDPRFVYLSPGHEEALEHMVYGVRQRKGFILITGHIGAGKTTLTRMLLDQLDENAATALIFNTFLNEIELLRNINREFGLPAGHGSREALIQTLNGFLIQQLREDRDAVLILDEAQNLSVPVMEQIRMLSNLETDNRKLIQIIMVGQPELAKILTRPDLRQLNDRITVRCHLSPLDGGDIARYVHHRLTVAGPQSRARFSPRTYQLIGRYTGGVPRRINALCDRSLLAAYARGSHEVRPGHVKQAKRELEGRLPAGAQEEPTRKTHPATAAAAFLLAAGLVFLVYWTYIKDYGVWP